MRVNPLLRIPEHIVEEKIAAILLRYREYFTLEKAEAFHSWGLRNPFRISGMIGEDAARLFFSEQARPRCPYQLKKPSSQCQCMHCVYVKIAPEL
jgi:hypothetical protein